MSAQSEEKKDHAGGIIALLAPKGPAEMAPAKPDRKEERKTEKKSEREYDRMGKR
jgi:hypothetical protein